MSLTSEQLRDAFGLVDKMIECNARLSGAADDEWRFQLETSITECAQRIRDYLEASERSEWAERLAFETETINRALQHDVVLFGKAGAGSALVFSWRLSSGTMGPQFEDRALAIDWMAAWLTDDVGEQVGSAGPVPESARMGDDASPPTPGVAESQFVGSAEQFAKIARELSAEPTVAATLKRIVDFAAETIDGCDGAGVLLVDRRQIVVGAWSNDLVHRVEEMEYELGEGPCLDAIWEQRVFESADLRDHLSQWPNFAREALEAGIQSMVGFRLFVDEDTLGALDLYGYARGAFDETSRAIGSILASHAALALGGAQLHQDDLDTVAGLREALVTRDVIGQAKGILMATRHVDADTAFTLLVRASQTQNVKVRDIAEEVARTQQLGDETHA
jgi:putative methionine-R-sulfoxide reductase with GAF domain